MAKSGNSHSDVRLSACTLKYMKHLAFQWKSGDFSLIEKYRERSVDMTNYCTEVNVLLSIAKNHFLKVFSKLYVASLTSNCSENV